MVVRGGRRISKSPTIVPGATVNALRGSGAQGTLAPQVPGTPRGRPSAGNDGAINPIRGLDLNQPFSPQQPVEPYGPEWNINQPVEWDYSPGYNLQFQPPQVDLFEMLRSMAKGWGVLATIIQKRTDQILRLPYEFQIIGDPKADDPRLDELRKFFKRPDRKKSFGTWQRALWADHFEIDAATIHIWRSNNGKPYALEVLDGTKIKPLIDDMGRRPDYPSPAFQQIRRGMPFLNLTEQDLIYAPMRIRPERPVYGYSPVEQIFVNVAEAIKKDMYMNNFWQSGNLPDLIVTVPDNWKPAQIASFQAFFEQYSGNPSFKTRVRFVPGGMKPFDIKGSSGESLWSGRDEILIRIACFAFGMSPQAFMKMVNRSTAQSASEEAEEQGLHPELRWFKEDIMDLVVQEDWGFGYDDIEFVYLPDPQVDAKAQMETMTGYVKEGIMRRNEARDMLNLQEVPGGDELTVDTPNGPVPLKETIDAAKELASAKPQQTQEKHESDMAVAEAKVKQPAAPEVGKQLSATFREARPGFLRRRA